VCEYACVGVSVCECVYECVSSQLSSPNCSADVHEFFIEIAQKIVNFLNN
jgi:hypothetical protein